MKTARTNIENPDMLVARTVSGDPEAWAELARRVHRAAVASCSTFRGRETAAFLGDGDLEQEVAARVLGRLRESHYRSLTGYLQLRERYRDTEPDGERSLTRWLTIVTKRIRIDYLRSLPEYMRLRDGQARKTHKVVVSSLTGDEPHSTADVAQRQCDRIDIQRILSALEQSSFPRPQRAALLLWLQGGDAQQIATRLELADAQEARRLLRAARQRLRRIVPRDGERVAMSTPTKRGCL